MVLFPEPTPGSANTAPGYRSRSAVQKKNVPVRFSPPGGFYEKPQTVSLSADLPGAEIRYTLDGSDPTHRSPLYTRPVPIGKTGVLSARPFDRRGVPRRIATHTYFINVRHTLPVVSVTTDPPNLWDPESGIYAEGANYDAFEGKANYLERWEKPARIEFYEQNGAPVFRINAGLKIHGGSSRDYDQKSLGIYARKKLGPDRITCKLFPDEPVTRFKSFILRNDGCCDDQRTLFRDAVLHRLLRGHTDVDLQAYRPAILYLNGGYRGIMNLREKLSEHYLAARHGVSPDAVDLLEDSGSVIEGRADHYKKLLAFVRTADMTRAENYRHVQAQMDTDQYADYQIAEIYSANTDWPGNNIRYWRPRTPEGRWRWILCDTDYSFIRYEYRALRQARKSQILLDALLKNTDFRNRFIQGMAAHLNTTFRPERVIGLINDLRAGIQAEMPAHIRRWAGKHGSNSIMSMSQWEENIGIRRTFAARRPAYVRQHFAEHFRLSGTAALTLNMNDANGGRVEVNSVAMPRGMLKSIWFRDIPLRLKAVPNPGYRFVRWQEMPGRSGDTLSIALTGDFALTAVFEKLF